ncbi:MAG TPA: tandem-95 repeat protein, partial [Bauldia sp.]|nr:tandem-95 repeat protein [Bauldia sp.]
MPDLHAGSDTGSSDTDDLTSESSPTFMGTATPGAAITLKDGSSVVASGYADDNGDWTITVLDLTLGAHTITATATDAAGNESAASTGLTVTIVGSTPVAVADTLAATEDVPVVFAAADLLGNDTDFDTPAGGLSIASVTSGTGGTASLNLDGTVSFTPGADFNGPASFTYTITDGTYTSAPATVTVDVAPVDDDPVVVPDGNDGDDVSEAGQSPAGTPFAGDPTASGDVFGNDTDPDGGGPLTVVGVAAGTEAERLETTVGAAIDGTYGTLTLNADGTWTYLLDNDDPDTQALAEGEPASDVFAYVAVDAGGAEATTTLTIAITGTNDAPGEIALSNATVGSGIADVGIGLLSATDPEGNAVTWSLQPGLDEALFTLQGNQLRVGGTPLGAGTLQVVVRAADSFGAWTDRTIDITVVEQALVTLTEDDDPVAMPETGGYVVGTATTLNAGDSLAGGAGHDVLALYGNGAYRLDQVAAFSDFDEVQLVTDSLSGTMEVHLPGELDLDVTATGVSSDSSLSLVLGD